MMSHDHTTEVPSDWIARFAPLVRPGGSVLDVACGYGRHCRLFRKLGHKVTGLDKDVGQSIYADGTRLIAADLENGSPWPLAGETFDAIVVTNYLWRPLFPQLKAALAEGGVLIYETYAVGNEIYGKPRRPEHLLARGELLGLVQGLTVVAYEDGIAAGEAVVQRLCAVNAPGPFPLP